VRGVGATPAAVLLELDPVSIVVTVFLRYVVTPFALTALKRYMHTFVASQLTPPLITSQ
jgi:hypothetical protein